MVSNIWYVRYLHPTCIKRGSKGRGVEPLECVVDVKVQESKLQQSGLVRAWFSSRREKCSLNTVTQ